MPLWGHSAFEISSKNSILVLAIANSTAKKKYRICSTHNFFFYAQDDDPTTFSKPQAISLILLGAAQSGKSTLFRQLEILHGNCFSTMYERLNYR